MTRHVLYTCRHFRAPTRTFRLGEMASATLNTSLIPFYLDTMSRLGAIVFWQFEKLRRFIHLPAQI